MWKLWHNGIATTSNLQKRGVSNSREFPICLDDQEDIHHLFRLCPLSLEAWDQSQLNCNTINTVHMAFRDWLSHCILHFTKEDGVVHGLNLPKFVDTLWAIWYLRNNQVFRQQRPTTTSITMQLQESAQQHLLFV